MDTGDKIFFALGLLFAAYGLGGFLATWIFPRLQVTFLYKPFMLTGLLPPTNANRILMSSYSVAWGAYMAASSSGQRMLSYVFLAGFLVCAIKMLTARRAA